MAIKNYLQIFEKNYRVLLLNIHTQSRIFNIQWIPLGLHTQLFVISIKISNPENKRNDVIPKF